MDVAFFSTKPYDRHFFEDANTSFGFKIKFLEARLDHHTASLAKGYEAVCAFVNDELDAESIKRLADLDVHLIAMRCAGYNNVDLRSAEELDMMVVRVPAYSPNAVAEHTLTLILALNRKVHRAYNRVREGNFALDGLIGFDMQGKVAGVIGTGKIGTIVVKLLTGFGCRVLANDPFPNSTCEQLGAEYVDMDTLLTQSDIITLHCPLTPDSKHLIDKNTLEQMKDGVMLINTSRGALINSRAVIRGLKSGKIGYLGLDVYEEEGDLFFEDLSNTVIQDDIFARLMTFPNVIITGHQAFLTNEALQNIAQTTLMNIQQFEQQKECDNQIGLEMIQ